MTDDILEHFKRQSVQDKIVIIRLYGTLEQGKTSDIDFAQIESELRAKGAYAFLKNTSKLSVAEKKVDIELKDSENLEFDLIKKFEEKNDHKFNSLIYDLIRSLSIEKLEDEKNQTFEERLLSEANAIIKNEI